MKAVWDRIALPVGILWMASVILTEGGAKVLLVSAMACVISALTATSLALRWSLKQFGEWDEDEVRARRKQAGR